MVNLTAFIFKGNVNVIKRATTCHNLISNWIIQSIHVEWFKPYAFIQTFIVVLIFINSTDRYNNNPFMLLYTVGYSEVRNWNWKTIELWYCITATWVDEDIISHVSWLLVKIKWMLSFDIRCWFIPLCVVSKMKLNTFIVTASTLPKSTIKHFYLYNVIWYVDIGLYPATKRLLYL